MGRVAVTGSSGKLGRAVVDHLVEHGWDVVALDRVASPGADVVSSAVELTDFGQAVEALSGIDDRHDGVDALVHLAAIPAPGLLPNAATFANNITASYNAYSAAIRAGVRKIVWASSETGARSAVRRAATVRTRRRGVPTPSEQHLLAGQDTRGRAGPPAVPMAPGSVPFRGWT